MQKVTIIERLTLQHQRIEGFALAVAALFGHDNKLAQDLHHEAVVTRSILDQVKDEATAKVEETAAAEPAEREVPPEVKAILDGIVAQFKDAGIDVVVHEMPIPRVGSIADILKKI